MKDHYWSCTQELIASLRLLYVDQQFSDTDIALFFGVSRERARQWRARAGIPTALGRGLKAIRYWDDATHQFRPVPKRVVRNRAIQERRAVRVARSKERRTTCRAQIVTAIRALYAEYGEVPTIRQIAERVGFRASATGAGPFLCARWAGKGASPRGTLGAMWDAAGIGHRPRGNPGHVVRANSLYCKRGHWMAGKNAYYHTKRDGSVGRSCRTCQMSRAKVRAAP